MLRLTPYSASPGTLRSQAYPYLRHVVEGGPFPWDFAAGARGVQLAELGLRSAREGLRLEIPELER